MNAFDHGWVRFVHQYNTVNIQGHNEDIKRIWIQILPYLVDADVIIIEDCELKTRIRLDNTDPNFKKKLMKIKTTGITESKLFEGLSSILYHATGIWKVFSILQNNIFLLTPSIGTDSDNHHKNKIYFLSTTRSKVGQYHYPVTEYQSGQCLIVLDGQKLMADGFSGESINYWGHDYKSKKNEMEDRILSSKSEIPNAMKYIKEIHVLLEQNTNADLERIDNIKRILRKTMIMCKKSEIPIFVYNDFNDFNLLQKNKANQNTNLKAETPLPEPRSQFPRTNYFGPYIELLIQTDRNKLSNESKRLLGRWYNERDRLTALKNEIHNNKSDERGRPNLIKFLNIMKKLNLNSVKDVYDYIDKKWAND